MNRDAYYEEALEIAFCEEGLSEYYYSIPEKTRKNIAGALAISRECEGVAFGDHCIPNPVESENVRLKKEIAVLKNHDCSWVTSSSTRYREGGGSDTSYCTICDRTKVEKF